MPLQPGQTLSHYRVERKIGQGGMGEVWSAVDTRLNRAAAIKALPASLAEDPERLARFKREAQLLASLNHPNIAGIYGLEQEGDSSYLAMELVEGDDLSERIEARPLPVEEALDIAGQIAAALEEAHDKGIVHRDLKPANIKVTPDGKVKVLDFGLAKALTGDQGTSGSVTELSLSPTMTAAMGTQAGVILGTAAYMSPEQARGKPVDRRADIWAFGVVLFEMLTGGGLYRGRDRHRHHRRRGDARTRLGQPPRRDAGKRAPGASPLPAEGPAPAAARHRRRSSGVDRGTGGRSRRDGAPSADARIAHLAPGHRRAARRTRRRLRLDRSVLPGAGAACPVVRIARSRGAGLQLRALSRDIPRRHARGVCGARA